MLRVARFAHRSPAAVPYAPRFKVRRWKPGMVYAVPLQDGSFGFAQAIAPAMPTVVDLAVFGARAPALPTALPPLGRDDLVALCATWRQELNNGSWHALGVTTLSVDPMDCPNQKPCASGNDVGIEHYDAGLIERLLDAWHGLTAWNVMYEEDFFDEMLAPGVTRPSTAIVLSPEERAQYREARRTGHEAPD